MFGIGSRSTSYAFAAAALFLWVAGQPYHKFAFVSLVCALVFAHMKIYEEMNDRKGDLQRREMEYSIEDLKEELRRDPPVNKSK